jgi:hypothetical protein
MWFVGEQLIDLGDSFCLLLSLGSFRRHFALSRTLAVIKKLKVSWEEALKTGEAEQRSIQDNSAGHTKDVAVAVYLALV